MSFDPGNLNRDNWMPHEMWNRIFTNLVFESFIKRVVREQYHPNPRHVSLHVTRTEAMLYIDSDSGGALMIEDEDLRDWAYGFIAKEVFSVSPDDVDVIYLDGAVGGQDAYLHIAGKGIYISSSDSERRGTYL